MKLTQIHAVFFSPTGGTKKTVLLLAEELGRLLDLPVKETDLTTPAAREVSYSYGEEDLLVFGSPVYAGRLPNKIMPDFIRCLSGEGAAAVPLVAYGNRSFGSALTEIRKILDENGFAVFGAAAMVCRHSFSDLVAAGRPDEEDQKELCRFAAQVADELRQPEQKRLPFGADEEIAPYYTPLAEDGTPANFLRAKAKTDKTLCDHCGLCEKVCPIGSITESAETDGICIKCQACIRSCPKKARFLDDPAFLSHVRMLERDYLRRGENAFLLP